MPYATHVNANTGDLLQRCSSDVETVRRFMAVQLVELTRTVCTLGFALFLMLGMNVPMTLISLIVVLPLFGFSLWFYKVVRKTFKAVDEAEGRLSTVMQENLTGVRWFGLSARKSRRWRSLTERPGSLWTTATG